MNQSEAIEVYANEIPKEVRDVINGLSKDIRMAIIVGLLKNEKLTFTELKKLFSLDSSSLSHHLSLMMDGGIVDNIVNLKEVHSYYKATDIARLVLESISNIVLGITTPTTRSGPVTVQNPQSVQDTSGVFTLFRPHGSADWKNPNDLRRQLEEQDLPEHDSESNRLQEEQSSGPLQTAAGIKRRQISTR